MTDEQPKRVHLVVLGFPDEVRGGDINEAERRAKALLRKHEEFRHASILTVDADWENWTLVAENVGIITVKPEDMNFPTDNERDDF